MKRFDELTFKFLDQTIGEEELLCYAEAPFSSVGCASYEPAALCCDGVAPFG